MRRITMVRLDGDRVEIAHDDKQVGRIDHYTMNSAAAPRPSFKDAMADVVGPAAGALELPAAYRMSMKATKVSIGYHGENEVMGVVVTLKKRLQAGNREVAFNTPHQTEEPLNEKIKDTSGCMSTQLRDAVRQVMIEAERYLDGEREQADLFEEQEGGAPQVTEEGAQELQEAAAQG